MKRLLQMFRNGHSYETVITTITADYVREWGVNEALREFIQNALDHKDFQYYWEKEAGGTWSLELVSKNVVLDDKMLLLGQTTKRDDDDTIGKFGEGFKLALMVLAREGCHAVMQNGDVDWEPVFTEHPALGHAVFAIARSPGVGSEHLRVIVTGIGTHEKDRCVDGCLQMQDARYMVGVDVKEGTILNLHPGKIFCDGLYVDHIDGFKYGYNIKSKHLALERDRKTIDAWDLRWTVGQMWAQHPDADYVANLMEARINDLEHIQHHMTQRLKDACYALFRKKYPNAVAVETQQELQRVESRGYTGIIIPSAYHMAVTGSSHYDSELRSVARETPATEFINEWVDTNSRYMNRYGKQAMKELRKAGESLRWAR